MSKVYVVQNTHHQNGHGELAPKFNLEPAKKHGDLVFLLSPTARPFSSEPIVEELRRKLADYTDRDSLLLIGNPALIGFTVAIAANFSGGRVNVLQWDGKAKDYIVVSADLKIFEEVS